MYGARTISFWLRYGGWGALFFAAFIIASSPFRHAPERADLIPVEGQVVEVTQEAKTGNLEPASRLHVRDATGRIHTIRVQGWRFPYSQMQSLEGRRIDALYGNFFSNGWAYELVVEETTIIPFEAAAVENAAVKAKDPYFIMAYLAFGVLFLGAHRLLFGSFTSWIGPSSAPPIDRPSGLSRRTSFGQR